MNDFTISYPVSMWYTQKSSGVNVQRLSVFDTTARKGIQVVGDLFNRHFIAQLIYTRIFTFLSILIYQVNQLDLWHLIVLLLHCYRYQCYQDFPYT